jgi:DNA-directed RNA polymerase subunit RPC12/RpoP
MCADGWDITPDTEAGELWGECPDCGEKVIVYPWGEIEAATGCNYGTRQCDLCGSRPCDQSC